MISSKNNVLTIEVISDHKWRGRIKWVVYCLLLLFIACNQKPEKVADGISDKTKSVNHDPLSPLFKSGEAGYACFRIPAIVKTTDGSLLAFCEARKNGCSDTGDIDMVMKKSEDEGESWSELKVIWNDGENVCGNPAPVVDTETGQIHLLATWNNGNDKESQIIEGTSIEGREVFQLISDDDGMSWSDAKKYQQFCEITRLDLVCHRPGAWHPVEKATIQRSINNPM